MKKIKKSRKIKKNLRQKEAIEGKLNEKWFKKNKLLGKLKLKIFSNM